MLSILIPTLNSRSYILSKLQSEIERQIDELPKKMDKVEVIICADDGGMSIGSKRQHLLESALNEYVVFIDDDDEIASDYVLQILTALKSKPDCIGFKGKMITNGRLHDKWIISHAYKAWAKGKDGYVRHTNHLTPVKRAIALKAGFQDLRHGEDHKYSMALVPLIKKEVFIDKELYVYKYNSRK